VTFLRSFAQFWYDFIIGDDYKIAVAVVSTLALLYALLRTEILSDHVLSVLGGLLVMAAFTISLAIDVRTRR
jgi:hypothetical protein